MRRGETVARRPVKLTARGETLVEGLFLVGGLVIYWRVLWFLFG